MLHRHPSELAIKRRYLVPFASFIIGSNISFLLIVPYFSRAVSIPSTSPGTRTDVPVLDILAFDPINIFGFAARCCHREI